MKNILKSLPVIFSAKVRILIFVLIFFLNLIFYALTIDKTGGFSAFFYSTQIFTRYANIFFILLNSLLFSINILFTIHIFQNRQVITGENPLFFLKDSVAVFLSFISTGCFVCGNLILPFLGTLLGFSGLAFSGLEIKFVISLILIFSLKDYSKQVLGICKVEKGKTILLKINSSTFTFNTRKLFFLKPIGSLILLFLIIYLLPSFYKLSGINQNISLDNSYSCTTNQ